MKNSGGLTVTNNTVLDFGNYGMGNSGHNWQASGNKVGSNNSINSNLVAALDNDRYNLCANMGPCVWTNNIMTTHLNGTGNNYYWAGNGAVNCSTKVAGYQMTGTLGAGADTALGLTPSMGVAQVMAVLPPPAIPPLPKNCVAKSPFSNNTTKSACP
jgi:hypothetical protein